MSEHGEILEELEATTSMSTSSPLGCDAPAS
jgi:hypothetical protein